MVRLSLHKKLGVLMFSFLFAAVIGFSYAKYVQTKTINLLCRNIEEEFTKKVNLKAAPIKTFVNDYSYWDDMVNFVKSGNSAWAGENIDVCIPTLEADAIWIYGNDSSLVYSVTTPEANTARKIAVPQSAFEKMFGKNRFCHFFINVPKGLMEIYGATVHPTFDADRKTNPKGFLLAGRVWSKDYVKKLEQITGANIEILSQTDKNEPVKTAGYSGGQISFSNLLQGWDGKPVACAGVRMESQIVKNINSSLNRQFYSMAAIALAVLCLVYFFLVQWINKPLSLISGSLNFEDPGQISKLRDDKTEFGYVARLILKIFEQKLQLLKEAGERKKSEDALKNANEELIKQVKEFSDKLNQPGSILQADLDKAKQKNTELINEINDLRKSQQSVSEAYAELDRKFKQRTTELHSLHELLRNETSRENKQQKQELVKAIYERKQIEKELDKTRVGLEHQKTELAALKELLGYRVSAGHQIKEVDHVGYGGHQ